jgi:hypothetical protein
MKDRIGFETGGPSKLGSCNGLAAALRQMLAPEALGKHPRTELARRAEAMVEDELTRGQEVQNG